MPPATLSLWRIAKAVHAATAFDGEGARLYGGRWNSPGVAMVYTSDSPALAALELLTQLNDATRLPRFVLVEAEVPAAAVETLDVATLPPRWRSYPAPPELQVLGDAWVKSGRSLALRVPSAVLPRQSNCLLNPAHPQFAKVRLGRAEAFDFDLRLLRE